MKDIKLIAKALSEGNVKEAAAIKSQMVSADQSIEDEINEVARQAVIQYLKTGSVYNAREAERLFKLPKDEVEDAVKQAVMSSLRDGDIETIVELKTDLPISKSMAQEILEYTSSWGKASYIESMQAVFA